jgi:hypothetical protein
MSALGSNRESRLNHETVQCVFAFPAIDGFPVASPSHRLAGPARQLAFGPVPSVNWFSSCEEIIVPVPTNSCQANDGLVRRVAR